MTQRQSPPLLPLLVVIIGLLMVAVSVAGWIALERTQEEAAVALSGPGAVQ